MGDIWQFWVVLGILIGLPTGWILGGYLVAKLILEIRGTNMAPTPDVERLLGCMVRCSEKHAFGSDEWSACVDRCFKAKTE